MNKLIILSTLFITIVFNVNGQAILSETNYKPLMEAMCDKHKKCLLIFMPSESKIEDMPTEYVNRFSNNYIINIIVKGSLISELESKYNLERRLGYIILDRDGSILKDRFTNTPLNYLIQYGNIKSSRCYNEINDDDLTLVESRVKNQVMQPNDKLDKKYAIQFGAYVIKEYAVKMKETLIAANIENVAISIYDSVYVVLYYPENQNLNAVRENIQTYSEFKPCFLKILY
jgi:hypothetical protein